MFTEKVISMILVGIKDTLYMTLVSTFFGYVLGLPLGILLNVTRKDGLKPNRIIYGIRGNIKKSSICRKGTKAQQRRVIAWQPWNGGWRWRFDRRGLPLS